MKDNIWAFVFSFRTDAILSPESTFPLHPLLHGSTADYFWIFVKFSQMAHHFFFWHPDSTSTRWSGSTGTLGTFLITYENERSVPSNVGVSRRITTFCSVIMSGFTILVFVFTSSQHSYCLLCTGVHSTGLTPVAGPIFEAKIERYFLESFFRERNYCPRTAFSGSNSRSILSNQVISWNGSRADRCPLGRVITAKTCSLLGNEGTPPYFERFFLEKRPWTRFSTNVLICDRRQD